MAYTKQTWANDAGGGTPINATRLNYMETGIEAAAANRESHYYPEDYGAVGNGSTDDSTAIRAALDAARTAGGGTVVFKNATYLVSMTSHPTAGSTNGALFIGAKTRMVGASQGGTVIKLANSQTVGNDVAGNNFILVNRNMTSTDNNIVVENLTLDGNAANQTHTHLGAAMWAVDRVTFRNVTVKNCRGTSGSGANECFFFDAHGCSNVLFDACIAESTAGSTATGFASNYSTNVMWSNCIAYGMTVAHGYAIYGTWNAQTVNCRAFSNASMGFNAEYSRNVVYTNCIAGGQAAANTGIFTASQDLGNGTHGFVNLGSEVEYNGCISTHNTQRGLMINPDMATLSVPDAMEFGTGGITCFTRVNGGFFGDGNDYGISVLTASADTGTYITNVSPSTQLTGNTGAAFYLASLTSGSGDYLLTAPSAPASTVAINNPFPFTVQIVMTATTITSVSLGGTASSVAVAAPTSVLLRTGKTIAVTYTGTLTWRWVRA